MPQESEREPEAPAKAASEAPTIELPRPRGPVTAAAAQRYGRLAVEAHPGLQHLEGGFVAHLQTFEHAPDLTAQAPDLLVAHGACVGDAPATDLLMTALAAETTAALACLHSTLAVDEAVRLVRARLLVPPPGGVPQLTAYRGDAPLAAFLRIVATRLVLEERPRTPEAHDLEDAVVRGPRHTNRDMRANPDVLAFRRRHTDAFRAAFAEAETALPVRDRAVLRYALCEELTVVQIARIYGVHRASATRWLGDARDRLEESLTEGLTARCELDARESARIAAALGTQLDAALARLLDPSLPRAAATGERDAAETAETAEAAEEGRETASDEDPPTKAPPEGD